MVTIDLEILRNQIANLSVEDLVELRVLIDEQLAIQTDTKSNGQPKNGLNNGVATEQQREAAFWKAVGVLPKPTEEEIEADLNEMFSPAEREAMHKVDVEALLKRPLPESWSDTVIEMRGGEI